MRGERFDVLVDGSNVVMHNVDEAGKGKTETLKQVASRLEEAELEFFVIFDKGIMKKCDDPHYVRRLEKRGEALLFPAAGRLTPMFFS